MATGGGNPAVAFLPAVDSHARNMPMSESAGKVVMVTGGGSGIGRATALLFGQEAARVAVIDCNERSTRETASLIEQQRGEALPLVADVSNNRD